MAWVAPPSWATGDVITAVKLNQLSDCVNWNNAVGAAPSIGFTEWTTTNTSTHAVQHYLARYTARYLHAITNAQDSGILKITVNGTVVLNIGSMSNGYVDHICDCNSAGMTLNSWYDITVEMTTNSGTNRLSYLGYVNGSGAIV